MRVLVTGATGFVGYAVADRLCRDGHEVWGLARSDGRCPTGSAGSSATCATTPRPGRRSTRRFDAVCHLAALVRARDSRADPVGYWRTNVGGTLAVLRRSRRRRGRPRGWSWRRRARCTASRARPRSPRRAPTQPTSPYGASKLAADRAVADLADTGVIGAVSLRAFNVAGGLPGHADRDETRLVAKAVAVARGGRRS